MTHCKHGKFDPSLVGRNLGHTAPDPKPAHADSEGATGSVADAQGDRECVDVMPADRPLATKETT